MEIPHVVRNKAVAVGAELWLSGLEDLVAGLAIEWGLTIGEPYTGGTEAYVCRVTLDDGTPAVLKVLVPQADAAAEEITVLRLAGGDACPVLYRADEARGALLIERLGPSMADLALPVEQRHALLCDLAARLWRPAPDVGLRTGAAKGEWLIEFVTRLWDELDHPCTEAAVADALGAARRRIAAHDDERASLVHGDVQQWNALRAGAGWKLVDPDGLLCEREYDLGILMREDPLDGDLHERSRWLARRTGLDERAIWDWGVVERVSTGLLATRVDLQPLGRQMLAVADRLAQRSG